MTQPSTQPASRSHERSFAHSEAAFLKVAAIDARRGQLAGAGVQGGRRDAGLHQAGRRVRSSPTSTATATSTTSRSYGPLIAGHANETRGRGAVQGDRPRDELRGADRGRVAARVADRRGAAVGRDGALRQQRHRGRDERASASRGPRRVAISSSSASAATTATSTRCSSRRAAAP